MPQPVNTVILYSNIKQEDIRTVMCLGLATSVVLHVSVLISTSITVRRNRNIIISNAVAILVFNVILKSDIVLVYRQPKGRIALLLMKALLALF